MWEAAAFVVAVEEAAASVVELAQKRLETRAEACNSSPKRRSSSAHCCCRKEVSHRVHFSSFSLKCASCVPLVALSPPHTLLSHPTPGPWIACHLGWLDRQGQGLHHKKSYQLSLYETLSAHSTMKGCGWDILLEAMELILLGFA